MLRWIAGQVSADPGDIESYAKRDPTRREHFLELPQDYSWHSFGLHEYREMSAWLMNQARSTDLGLALITLLISELRHPQRRYKRQRRGSVRGDSKALTCSSVSNERRLRGFVPNHGVSCPRIGAR